MSTQERKNARRLLAASLSFVQSQEVADAAAGTTLASSIAEGINALDSAQVSAVEDISEGTPRYLVERSGGGKGQLQRLQELREAMLGDDGLLEAMREMTSE